MARDVFKEISDRIAAQLENGVRPWSRPWKSEGAGYNFELPHNAATKKPYRGANVWFLIMIQQSRGYPTAQWLTFKGAQALGGNVMKGESATPVFFWKMGTRKDAATGEDVKTFMLRQYFVFNVAQCENLKLPERKEVVRTEAERNAAADAMIEATGAQIKFGGDRAYYSPTYDYVALPHRDQFHDADGYYGTAFHELGHWTGHEKRLNREFGKKFGDDAYAFEELVAELTAAYICGANGFASTDRDDHAAYIGSWLKRIKEDPKAFITAASKAQNAAELIMGKTAAQESEETDEVSEVA